MLKKARSRIGLFVMAFAVALCFMTAQVAKADTLNPGDTASNSGDMFSGDPNSLLTILATTGAVAFNVTNALGQVVDTGFYDIWVAADSGNTLCGAGGGCITIVAQVAEVTGDGLGAISFGSFSGFDTDVGYFPGFWSNAIASAVGSTLPEVDASMVARSGGTGSTITYNFNGLLQPGNQTDLLAIRTNGTSYVPGTMQLIDNGTANVIGYAPAVPEPAVVMLLGLGLLALPLFGRRSEFA